MLSCLAFVLPASAAQQITVEIVNLKWTVRAGHNGSFHAKAILPDGAHVMLVCQAEGNLCNFSTKKLGNASGCDREHMVVTCTASGLGYFRVRREGEYVWIFSSQGKAKYQIVGPW